MELPQGARHWFHHVAREFSRWFKPMCGQPITYCEIGCWLGGSAEWACQNMLTHADARGYGIDPYLAMTEKHPQEQMDAVKAYAAERLLPWAGKWTWLYGKSEDRLAWWNRGTINALYIDGDHSAAAIIQDFRLALPHLSEDAIVVFDDYGNGLRKGEKTTPTAVEVIETVCGRWLRKIGERRQYAIRMTGRPPDWLAWPEELPDWEAPQRIPRIPRWQLTKRQLRQGRIARRERWARERAAKAE